MSTELLHWASIERQFLREDMQWLKAGAKLFSPSGDDITAKKLEQLEARLEHLDGLLQSDAE